MKKRYTLVLVSTILVFAAIIAMIGVIVSYLLSYTPIGPHLPNEPIIHYDENNNPVVHNPKNENVYNFLILGHDRVAALTDVIMLVNYNVTRGTVAIMQFPRDMYVSYGVVTNKINVSYVTFYNQARGEGSDQPELDGLRKFADHLEKALCTKISYTAILDLDGFRNIVDAVGGVEVDVPYEMSYVDGEQNLVINIPAGYQKLNGEQAERFVRFRKGYIQQDIGRQDAQKIFMSAFIKKVQSTVSVGTVKSLAEIIIENLHTDISISDFVYFAKNMLNVDMSDITMVSVPTNQAGFNGIDYLVLNKKGTAEIINEYFNVYDGEITVSIFDRNLTFATASSQICMNAYNADKATSGGVKYDADNINDDSINIPHY